MSTVFFHGETIGFAAECLLRSYVERIPFTHALLEWDGAPWYEDFIAGLAEFSMANARAYSLRYKEDCEGVSVEEIKAFLANSPHQIGVGAQSPYGQRLRTAARAIVDLGIYNCDDEELSPKALKSLMKLAQHLLRIESKGK